MRYALLLLCPVHTSLSTDVLVKFYSARAPRRFERGLTRKTIALIKKLRKAKREAPPCEKPEQVHTLPRNMIIVLEMIGSIIGVYNGKTFKHIAIKPEMIGHYLAEFSISYKPVKHGELDEKRVQEQRALDCLISLGSIQDTSAHQNEDAIFPLSSNNTDKSLPSLPVPNHLYHIVSEIVTHNELFSRGENGVYAKFNRMQKMAHGTAMNNARKSSVRPSSARNSVSSPIIAKNSSYGRSAYSLRLSGISTSDFSPSLDASQPNYRLEKLAFKKQANSFCQLAKMISPEWLYVLIGSIHSVVCGSLVPSLLMFLVLPLVSITVQTTDT